MVSELGASAGLNLIWDRFALDTPDGPLGPPDPVLRLTPDWRGLPPPAAAPVRIAAREGADIAPLDPMADRLRLMAYVWPDQPDRMARTALAAEKARRFRPPVNRMDAVDWLDHRLATPYPGLLHLIQHTVAWQYFPPETQARGEVSMAAAGMRATHDAPSRGCR